ncbi:mediator of DNA damage checkpoint protein 1-like isoform X1 [Haliotis rufescens]|uniref:mediator of DNA damage checkpoint protein 1-like isoform X1 n=1 Tax=Haliotis rufescens TaxID=6454 RepID=UPI00201ECE74|nr:mediator of DNA damage checkpoint protein 1-like isoform X1 [Haliotis rufescens]
MEKQYSVQFFTSFVENLQRLCQNYISYDQMVEVSGYISVEIDNAKKERYVLSELVQSTGNVISESYCTKVFKNCPLPVQRSPGQRREPPVMSQMSPAAKRPLNQTSPRLNRMGQSPQMNRQMSPTGVLRPSNDNNQRPSFNQRLNQSSGFGAGRGGPQRMNPNFSNSGTMRGGMPPSQRSGNQVPGVNPVGRPSLGGNPRMMNPSQRMNPQGGGMRQPGHMSSPVQRSGPNPSQRMGQQSGNVNSIQARRTFGPGQRPQPPQSRSPVDDSDELEVISFVPPPRRSVGEASTSSLSSGTRSPLTPETSSVTSNRPPFPSGNRSGSNNLSSQPASQAQTNSQSMVLPVSLVQNVAQPTAPQTSRNQIAPGQQTSQNQSMSHSGSQGSQASQQMGHQSYQGQNMHQNVQQNMPQPSQPSDPMSQPRPSRQQIVQQMLEARANRSLPSTVTQQSPQPVSQQSSQPTQQQGTHTMAPQHTSQPVSQKPTPPVPQQLYQNQNYPQMPQPPHTPPGQIMSNPLGDPTRNTWDQMSQPTSFPSGVDKKDPGLLGLNLPGLETDVDSTAPMEISARNSFMDSVTDRSSLAVSSSAPAPTVATSTHLPFAEDPLGSLQISNVVSLPQGTLPDIESSRIPSSFPEMNPSSTPSIIAEAFASLDPATLSEATTSELPMTSEANSSMMSFDKLTDDEDLPSKKARLSMDTSDQIGGPTSTVASNSSKPMVPIGRKLKEFAAKKRAKRGRPRLDKPPNLDKPEVSDEEGVADFDAEVDVDPTNMTLRSRGRNPLRASYNENSDSDSSLPEAFRLNFDPAVSTSAGLVLSGEGLLDDQKDSGKDLGGAGADTAPAPVDGNPGSDKVAHSTDIADSRKTPDVLSEADNESYILIELESDDEDDSSSGGADSSTVIVKQELSTFSKNVQFAINRLTQFMILKKVKEPAYTIMPETLDPLLAEFYLRLRKSGGQEFISSSLKQIQNCIGNYLTTNSYPFCIKSDSRFENSRRVMENKLKHLRSCEDAIFTMRVEDVDKLYEIGQLGSKSVDSLLNTLWLMNTVHFCIRRPKEHISLKWGELKLGRENHQEYLEYVPSGKIVWKRHDNPQRCFVTLYKKYRSMRPATAHSSGSTFYLAITDKKDGFKHQKYGEYKMANIFKRMLSSAGLPLEMKISCLDIL